MSATTLQHRGVARRIAYAVLGTLLVTAIVVEATRHATGYWQIAAFGIGPDLALLLGVGANLAHGQLHPRAVPAYNLLHRFWGPLVLGLVAAFDVVPVGFLIGALAWGFHIALDHSVGYGLRTRDGFQRT